MILTLSVCIILICIDMVVIFDLIFRKDGSYEKEN